MLQLSPLFLGSFGSTLLEALVFFLALNPETLRVRKDQIKSKIKIKSTRIFVLSSAAGVVFLKVPGP